MNLTEFIICMVLCSNFCLRVLPSSVICGIAERCNQTEGIFVG